LATSVYTTEDIVLSDGTELTLRPLPVKYLKRVLAKFGEYTKKISKAMDDGTADTFDPDGLKLIDNLTECCKIAFEAYKVEIVDIDEVLDMETIYKVLQVGADINLKEQTANLVNQAQAAVAAAGQN
jgi:hypothetical protein